MFCPTCGQAVADAEQFCPYCGTPVSAAAAPAAPATPAAAPAAAPATAPAPVPAAPGELRGVGGWLLVFCIWIAIIDPLMELRLLPYLRYITLNPFLLVSLGLTAYGVFTGIQLWTAKAQALSYLRIYFGIVLAAALLGIVLFFRSVGAGFSGGIWVFAVLGPHLPLSRHLGHLLPRLPACAQHLRRQSVKAGRKPFSAGPRTAGNTPAGKAIAGLKPPVPGV